MRTEEIAQIAIDAGIDPSRIMRAHAIAMNQAVINIEDGKDLKPNAEVITDVTKSVNSMTGWTAAKQLDITAQDVLSDSIATQSIADFKQAYLTINDKE